MLSDPEEAVAGAARVVREAEGGGVPLVPLEELRLTKFGCNMRTSFLAASLGWTGVVFR